MVTRFQSGRVSYSLITAAKGRRDWDLPLDAITADPALWSARDDAKGRGGKLGVLGDVGAHRRAAPRTIPPKTHYSDKARRRK